MKYNLERTSINHIPKLFKVVDWEPNTVNLDIGGGKYDTVTNFLQEKNVTNILIDPYSRTAKFNLKSIEQLQKQLVDTVTICNVLCVVKEKKIREEILLLAKEWIKPEGKVYISIYPGNGTGDGVCGKTNTWQNNKKLNEYLKEVQDVFPNAIIKNNYIFITKKGEQV